MKCLQPTLRLRQAGYYTRDAAVVTMIALHHHPRRSLEPQIMSSLARRISPIQIQMIMPKEGTLGMNRTKMGIDSSVNLTSLLAKISLLAKLRKNMILIPL